MKTMKNKIFVVLIATVFALPVMAQFEYNEPNAQFQSTSGLKTSGSTYSSNPTLNEDGTAPSPTGPRRAPKPINDDDDWEYRMDDIGGGISTPIGDAVLPLMLMAMAYAVYSVARVYRRKRRL